MVRSGTEKKCKKKDKEGEYFDDAKGTGENLLLLGVIYA